MKYYRLSQGFTHNEMLPVSKNPYTLGLNPNEDWYTSLYLYEEDHFQEWNKTKSFKGFSGVTTNKILFDFDDENNIDQARKDAMEVIARMVKYDIPRDDIQVCFSGKKGFSVQIKIDKELSPEELRAITQSLAGDLPTYDPMVYDSQRIIRMLGTRHQETSRYKIPLSLKELESLTVDEIKELASNYPAVQSAMQSFSWNMVKLPEILYNTRTLTKPKVQSKKSTLILNLEDLNIADRPRWLTPCKFVLQEGFFEAGHRREAMLILASTYKAQGFHFDMVWRMLKGVAQKQADIHDCDRLEDPDIYRVAKEVFSDGWRGGQYTCKTHPILQQICEHLGDKGCDAVVPEGQKIITMVDLKDSFKTFVKNIDENTILTGIPSIDNNVSITTGANVGIIGAPGCHAKGAEILMYDGTIKKVEDILVGDLLMGPDSSPREVLKLCRGREKMVKFKPLRSPEFTVNMGHILHLAPSHLKNNISIPGNLNIKVENYLKSIQREGRAVLGGYKFIKTGVDFKISQKELKIPPYILGAWLGDGTASKSEITSMDKEISNAWKEYAYSKGLVVREGAMGYKGRARSYPISGRSVNKENFVIEDLEYYNLLNNKHIPYSYLVSSREDRLELLAGLLDTDGYMESNKNGWEIASVSKQLSEGITFLARSLGFHVSVNYKKKHCYHKHKKVEGMYYVMYISGSKPYEVPVKLERKKVKKTLKINHLHYGLENYEILEEADYYGFTLDKDHLYLTSDFMIHHNSGKSSIALNILNNTSKQGIKSVFASLDMHSNRMFEKVLYKVSGLKRDELYKLFQEDKEQEIMQKIKDEFGNVNFFNKSCPSVKDVRDYIIRCQEQTGEKIKLVVLDYFERVTSDYSDDTQASKRVAGELQDLVNDLDIALITLVQPNKHGLSGGADSPLYSYTAIKGSSFVYQAFRIIMSIWRPFYSPKAATGQDKFMQMAVLKNDLGELNEFAFGWDGPRGEIRELSDSEKQNFEYLLDEKHRQEDDNSRERDW